MGELHMRMQAAEARVQELEAGRPQVASATRPLGAHSNNLHGTSISNCCVPTLVVSLLNLEAATWTFHKFNQYGC